MSINQLQRALFITALLVAGAAIPANAQPVYSDAAIKVGQTYWFMRNDGLEIRGVLTGRTASELHVGGERGPTTISMSDVFRISKSDGLKNGLLIGAAIGAVLGGGFALGTDSFTSAEKAEAVAQSVLAFGAFGALLDKVIPGRTDVYRRGQSASVSLAPITSGRRVGLRAKVVW